MDYIQNQQVVTLSLNAGATLSVTFLIDTIAFEPDETFVLELSVTSITPAASVSLLDASLINVFFQSRQNFIIQDSTGIIAIIFTGILYTCTCTCIYVYVCVCIAGCRCVYVLSDNIMYSRYSLPIASCSISRSI